jgi:hypothetical protein
MTVYLSCPTNGRTKTILDEKVALPIILWLLGVPVTLVLVLWFLGIMRF